MEMESPGASGWALRAWWGLDALNLMMAKLNMNGFMVCLCMCDLGTHVALSLISIKEHINIVNRTNIFVVTTMLFGVI